MDAAPRLLAVDGGQSAIRIKHSVGVGAVVPGVSWSGPDTLPATAASIVEAWRAAGAPLVDTAVLGLTTVPSEGADCTRLAGLVGDAIGAERVVVCDDGITAHAGALGGGSGIVLSVGTGVACAVRGPEDAEIRLLGGHGYILGDEGGAFWLGRAGLSAALRAADGRGQATTLVGAAESRFGAVPRIPIRLHSSRRAVDEIAHFALDVLAAADAGDRVAAGIVDDGIDELALLLRTARGSAEADAPTPLVILGRLGAELAPRIVDRLSAEPGAFQPREPLGDALDGAFLLARDAAETHLPVWTRG
jgi:N-acetylglucosamine kinase-like BadF-type ATPase